MATVKDEVREILDRLPEDCSLEDIQYHLYVAEKIQRGLRSPRRWRTTPERPWLSSTIPASSTCQAAH
ncbi:MAG: hypothetical protein KC994_25370 [Candidatus Omnitrophica bacterium]|nr:hypothetical protein [Candidatus Omnitrophota bacterium]